ncbi:MAG: GNAT family N-acetyltransferase [Anaerolineae bacterium]|nr:GNAT family N-acetyltransferase [Anaerolineae bacterium]
MSNSNITLIIGPNIPFEQLLALYNSVGWTAYTNEQAQDRLVLAIQNSTYVVTAWDGDRLVGLARAMSDDVAIFYLKDILIHPEYQRQGIATRLLRHCLERFEHVRNKVLLTDDEERQLRFYEKMGYTNTRNSRIPLNAFVQIRGIDL